MGTSLGVINFDCRDVQRQATFWAAVLGLTIDAPPSPEVAEFVATAHGQGMSMMFIHAEDRAPGKNPIHLDLVDDQYPSDVERIIGLGAEKIGEFDEYGTAWTTLRDPEGNLFDVGRAH